MTWHGMGYDCIAYCTISRKASSKAPILKRYLYSMFLHPIDNNTQQQWKNNLVVYRTIVSHRSNGMVVKKREETTCLAACLPIHQISIYQMPACQTTLLLPSYVPAITHHDTIVFCIGLEQFIIMVHALRCTTLNERTHSLTHWYHSFFRQSTHRKGRKEPKKRKGWRRRIQARARIQGRW